MTRNAEIIRHLLLLKDCAIKSHNDTGIININIDSFNFVIDMAIQALEKPTDWIPVSERLPELTIHDFGMSWSDYVLVYGITIEGEYGIAISQFCEEENEERGWCDAYIHIGTGKIDDVIAWMPLPEPYKDGGE